jgi:hypothetical protein
MATRCAATAVVDCEDTAKPDALMTFAAADALDVLDTSKEPTAKRTPAAVTVLVLVMSAAPRLTP